MLGFDIKESPSSPEPSFYTARKNIPKKQEGPKKPLGSSLDDERWIWEWALAGPTSQLQPLTTFTRDKK